MKKVFPAAIVLLLILSLLSGCHKTPDSPIVVGKDNNKLIENAQKDETENSDKSLFEQYGIPESYRFDKQGARGNLNIRVDAQVTVPEGNALPIYRVRLAEFSQESVSTFFNTLCGDAEMYIDSGQLTKDQIRQLIVKFKKRIAEIKDDPQLADELEMNEQLLAQYEQLLESAPDTLTEMRTDGTLIDMDNANSDVSMQEGDEPVVTPIPQTGGSETGLEAYERYNGGTGRMFHVYNDSSPSIVYVDFRNPAGDIIFGASSSLPVLEDSDVDAESLSRIGLKPSEAMEMVQDLLDKTDSSMVIDSMYLQDDTQYYDDGTVRPAEHYAYLIYCVRTVDGLPCSYVAGSSQPDADAMAPSWWYERMYFMVNSEGIFNMEWTCPLEVVETVNEDAQLKPFSQIQEIFEKMMLVKYEAQAENSKEDFEINRVTLSLHRIIEQNSNESGLLVPAWNFYGKQILKTDTPGLGGQYEYMGQSFLSINAIDGSVIDTYKGY